jgi:parallel beta-helix repeat protein
MNRKTVSGIMLTLLLIGMSTLSFNIQPVKANGTVIIVGPGVIPPTAPIIQDGNIFTLTDNINGSIIVVNDHVVLDGAGHTLKGNGYGEGIRLLYAFNVTVRNIEVKAFDLGISLPDYRAMHNTISGNNITNNWLGIYLGSSDGNNIFGNNITNNIYGIDLTPYYVWPGPVDNHISGNNIADNYYGVKLYSSENNHISGNNITNNGNYGIQLWDSNYNTISGNHITNNYRGMGLAFSSGNTGFRNNITDTYLGIYLYYSSDNEFYHNNLVDNTQQAYVYPSSYANFWDNGYPYGGNYWSDQYHGPFADHYSGSDQNIPGGDGITDAPYVIDAYNKDNYPLMEPWGVVRATVEFYPETLSLHSLFGRWIKAYIELPEGYDVSDIDISTVMLNDEVPAETHPTKVGDYDNDGISDLMVKFSRIDAMKSIFRAGGNTLTVSGEMIRFPFVGSDTIRVNNPH